MKPYYEASGITIYHGDCREILPTFATGEIPLTLTDPPYGVGFAHWDSAVPPMDWLVQCRRVSNCVVFTPGITHMMLYPPPSWTLCWARPASVQRNGLGGFNNWEPLFIYGAAKVDNDLMIMSHGGSEVDGHPCPKPEELMARVINKVGGDKVLDPFAGSGTTLVAAKNLGKQAIGIEINEQYCEIAAKRLSQEVFQF